MFATTGESGFTTGATTPLFNMLNDALYFVGQDTTQQGKFNDGIVLFTSYWLFRTNMLSRGSPFFEMSALLPHVLISVSHVSRSPSV